MGTLTEDLPKPMLPVAGKPMLEHVLDAVRAAGVSEALVVTGYRAEVIEEHFHEYAIPVQFVRQTVVNGTGAAALLAREFVGDGDFLFTFGDVMAAAGDYRGILKRLAEDPEAVAAAGVKRVEDPWQGAAVYERGGLVERIVEKPPRGTSSTHWNSAGLYAFRPAVFDELARIPVSPRGEYELTSAVEQFLAAGRRVVLYALEGEWKDVGRPEDLAAAQRILTKDRL